jgi:hypothetical protein
MIHKNLLRKILKKQKLNLLKHKTIDSPMFIIKEGDKKVFTTVLQPCWHTPEEKAFEMLKVRAFCEKVKASKVIMIADSYCHKFENEKKISTSDAILVSMETRDQMEFLTLPYTQDPNGKISFGEEAWEIKKGKLPGEMACEGLVQ